MAKLVLFILLCMFQVGAVKASTWLVVGDSLSSAYGIAEETGWVALLRKHMASTDPNIQVVNASISGDTTFGGVERLPNLIKEYAPSMVIIELGGNDGLRGFNLKKTEENLRQMVRLVSQSNAKAVLAGMQIPPNYGPFYSRRFAGLYKKVADSEDAVLVPFLLEGIAEDQSLFLDDGIHPNEKAQPIILRNVLNALK